MDRLSGAFVDLGERVEDDGGEKEFEFDGAEEVGASRPDAIQQVVDASGVKAGDFERETDAVD